MFSVPPFVAAVHNCSSLTFSVPPVVAAVHNCSSLTFSVPPVVAAVPGQAVGEAGRQVEDGPRQYHVVVDANEERDEEHGVPDACRQDEEETLSTYGLSSYT